MNHLPSLTPAPDLFQPEFTYCFFIEEKCHVPWTGLSFVTKSNTTPINKENTRLISEKIRSFVQIEFKMAKKVDYLIALINEFGRHYGLTDRDAYRYLKQYGFMSIYEDCYEYLHTQSFESAAQELAGFCRRNGGHLS